MSPVRTRPEQPWLQLLFAFIAAVVAYRLHPAAGVGALVLMGLVWPPAVPWLPCHVGRVLGAYLPFVALWTGFLVVYLQAMHAFGWPVAPQPMLVELAQQGVQAPGFVVTVGTIVLVGPVIEELLFRGYLFTALAGVLPNVLTQGITALVFGLVHGPGYALPIGVLSLLFGWLRHRHGALLPSVFAHMVHNCLTVLITVAWPGHLQWLYPQ